MSAACQQPGSPRERGFTLIELMITVAVVAILAAVAYPAYTEQVARGRRAQAQATLLAAQQWMERFYTENYRYDQNTAGTAVTDATLFPARFPWVPTDAAKASAYYTLAFSPAPTQSTYTLLAQPTGAMTNDRCGSYQVDHLGRKSLTGYDTSRYATDAVAIAACWR